MQDLKKLSNDELCKMLKGVNDTLALELERNEFLILRSHHFVSETDQTKVIAENNLRESVIDGVNTENETEMEAVSRLIEMYGETGILRKLRATSEHLVNDLKFIC